MAASASSSTSGNSNTDVFKLSLGEQEFSMYLDIDQSQLVIEVKNKSHLVVHRKTISTNEEVQQITDKVAHSPQQLFAKILSHLSSNFLSESGSVEFVESRNALIIKLKNPSEELSWTFLLERFELTAEMISEFFVRQLELMQKKQDEQHETLARRMEQMEKRQADQQYELLRQMERLENRQKELYALIAQQVEKLPKKISSTGEDQVDGFPLGNSRKEEPKVAGPQFMKFKLDGFTLSSDRKTLTKASNTRCGWQGFLSEQSFSEFEKLAFTVTISSLGEHYPHSKKLEQCLMIGVARRHTRTDQGVNTRDGTWMLHILDGQTKNCYVNGHHKSIKSPLNVKDGKKVTVILDIDQMLLEFKLDSTNICTAALRKDDDPYELVAAVDLYTPGQSVSFS